MIACENSLIFRIFARRYMLYNNKFNYKKKLEQL